MARKKISQAEANRISKENRKLHDRINDLERSIRVWRNWNQLPDGTEIAELKNVDAGHQWALSTANKLKHTVVAKFTGKSIVLVALPSPENK